MRNFIDKVTLDGSTNPSTLVLNGFRVYFDSDKDARAVFGILNRQRDAVSTLNNRLMDVAASIRRLNDETRDYLPEDER